MPGGDRTGPTGMGPMTGRGMGYCGGYDRPGFTNPIAGRGMGMGRGFGGGGYGRGGGRGWRNMYYATGLPGWERASRGMQAWGGMPYGQPYTPEITQEQELNNLKEQGDYLTNALKDIKKRIGELEQKKEK